MNTRYSNLGRIKIHKWASKEAFHSMLAHLRKFCLEQVIIWLNYQNNKKKIQGKTDARSWNGKGNKVCQEAAVFYLGIILDLTFSGVGLCGSFDLGRPSDSNWCCTLSSSKKDLAFLAREPQNPCLDSFKLFMEAYSWAWKSWSHSQLYPLKSLGFYRIIRKKKL